MNRLDQHRINIRRKHLTSRFQLRKRRLLALNTNMNELKLARKAKKCISLKNFSKKRTKLCPETTFLLPQ
jgi:hypothetical protein